MTSSARPNTDCADGKGVYKIPDGLRGLLEEFSGEVLRRQPDNIPLFLADYIERKLKAQDEKAKAPRIGGRDASEISTTYPPPLPPVPLPTKKDNGSGPDGKSQTQGQNAQSQALQAKGQAKSSPELTNVETKQQQVPGSNVQSQSGPAENNIPPSASAATQSDTAKSGESSNQAGIRQSQQPINQSIPKGSEGVGVASVSALGSYGLSPVIGPDGKAIGTNDASQPVNQEGQLSNQQQTDANSQSQADIQPNQEGQLASQQQLGSVAQSQAGLEGQGSQIDTNGQSSQAVLGSDENALAQEQQLATSQQQLDQSGQQPINDQTSSEPAGESQAELGQDDQALNQEGQMSSQQQLDSSSNVDQSQSELGPDGESLNEKGLDSKSQLDATDASSQAQSPVEVETQASTSPSQQIDAENQFSQAELGPDGQPLNQGEQLSSQQKLDAAESALSLDAEETAQETAQETTQETTQTTSEQGANGQSQAEIQPNQEGQLTSQQQLDSLEQSKAELEGQASDNSTQQLESNNQSQAGIGLDGQPLAQDGLEGQQQLETAGESSQADLGPDGETLTQGDLTSQQQLDAAGESQAGLESQASQQLVDGNEETQPESDLQSDSQANESSDASSQQQLASEATAPSTNPSTNPSQAAVEDLAQGSQAAGIAESGMSKTISDSVPQSQAALGQENQILIGQQNSATVAAARDLVQRSQQVLNTIANPTEAGDQSTWTDAVREFVNSHVNTIRQLLSGEISISQAQETIATITVSLVVGVVIGYAIAKSTGICSNGSPQATRITEVVTPNPVVASADMSSKVSYALAGVSPRPAPKC